MSGQPVSNAHKLTTLGLPAKRLWRGIIKFGTFAVPAATTLACLRPYLPLFYRLTCDQNATVSIHPPIAEAGLVCYRFSAVTPIVSLFTRNTLTPSLTGIISTRSPFASVDSIAFISFSDSLTGFFILYFTTMNRIVKGYAFSRLSFTRFLYSSVCSVAARFKKCIGFIPLLVPNS